MNHDPVVFPPGKEEATHQGRLAKGYLCIYPENRSFVQSSYSLPVNDAFPRVSARSVRSLSCPLPMPLLLSIGELFHVLERFDHPCWQSHDAVQDSSLLIRVLDR